MDMPVNLTNVIGGNVMQAKFDRQLRLWGEEGQQRLMSSHVVALGCTTAIAEALKSIVLCGVGAITIVDERTVSAEEVATNFFIEAGDVGTSLSRSCTRTLCELNPICTGRASSLPCVKWVDWYYDAVHSTSGMDAHFCLYNCVSSDRKEGIALDEIDAASINSVKKESSAVMRVCDGIQFSTLNGGDGECALPPPSLILVSDRYQDWSPTSKLANAAREAEVPLLFVSSRGLVGCYQAFSSDVVVLHTYPKKMQLISDLRVFDPFPELKQWFDAHDPNDNSLFSDEDPESITAHSHIPYICLLYHAHKLYQKKASAAAAVARATTTGSVTRGDVVGENAEHAAAVPSVLPVLGRPPYTLQEYSLIKAEVAKMVRRVDPPQMTLVEARQRCNKNLNRQVAPLLPASLKELFSDPRCARPSLAIPQKVRRKCKEIVDAAPKSVCQDYGMPNPSGQSSTSHTITTSTTALSAADSIVMILTHRPDVLVWYVIHGIYAFYISRIERSAASGDSHDESPLRDLGGGVEKHEHSCAAHQAAAAADMHVRGELPFCGYIPDIETTSSWYRELHTIYKKKHEEDVSEVCNTALNTLRHDAHFIVLQQCPSAVHRNNNDDNIHHHKSDALAAGHCGMEVTDSQAKEILAGSHSLRLLDEVLEELFIALHKVTKEAVANVWSMRLAQFTPSMTREAREEAEAEAEAEEEEEEAAHGGNNSHCCRYDKDRNEVNTMWHRSYGHRIYGALYRAATAKCDADMVPGCVEAVSLAHHLLEWRQNCRETQWTASGGGDDRALLVKGGSREKALRSMHMKQQTQDAQQEEDSMERELLCEVENALDSVMHHRNQNTETAGNSWRESAWWRTCAPVCQRACHEVIRPAATEVASVSAVIGSVAAQEAIKLLQGRSLPIVDTVVYSAITSTLNHI